MRYSAILVVFILSIPCYKLLIAREIKRRFSRQFMVHVRRLKSAKKVHVPECEDVAPRRALLHLKKKIVRETRAVATLCPFANKKGDGLCLHVGAKGKKLTHDTPWSINGLFSCEQLITRGNDNKYHLRPVTN